MTTNDLIPLLEALKNDCVSLMATATELYKSKRPEDRALAYEINIFVSKMMDKQKEIVKELNLMRVNKDGQGEQPEEISPANGYGALVD